MVSYRSSCQRASKHSRIRETRQRNNCNKKTLLPAPAYQCAPACTSLAQPGRKPAKAAEASRQHQQAALTLTQHIPRRHTRTPPSSTDNGPPRLSSSVLAGRGGRSREAAGRVRRQLHGSCSSRCPQGRGAQRSDQLRLAMLEDSQSRPADETDYSWVERKCAANKKEASCSSLAFMLSAPSRHLFLCQKGDACTNSSNTKAGAVALAFCH